MLHFEQAFDGQTSKLECHEREDALKRKRQSKQSAFALPKLNSRRTPDDEDVPSDQKTVSAGEPPPRIYFPSGGEGFNIAAESGSAVHVETYEEALAIHAKLQAEWKQRRALLSATHCVNCGKPFDKQFLARCAQQHKRPEYCERCRKRRSASFGRQRKGAISRTIVAGEYVGAPQPEEPPPGSPEAVKKERRRRWREFVKRLDPFEARVYRMARDPKKKAQLTLQLAREREEVHRNRYRWRFFRSALWRKFRKRLRLPNADGLDAAGETNAYPDSPEIEALYDEFGALYEDDA